MREALALADKGGLEGIGRLGVVVLEALAKNCRARRWWAVRFSGGSKEWCAQLGFANLGN